jgi:hypothetical protein
MAFTSDRNECTVESEENNIAGKDVIECKRCWYLKQELLELREELSSNKLIIQLLQMGNDTCDSSVNLNLDDGWTVESNKSNKPNKSNNSNKSNRPDTTNAERHSEERYGTSTDIMLTTTNRFGVLSDLDKMEEWPRLEDDLRGCLRRRRRKHNIVNTGNGKREDLVYQIPVIVDGLTSSDVDVLQHYKEPANHRIRIIGDSHARDAAGNVIDNLDNTYSISGFVCPGMNMSNMIPLMTSDITHLNSKDVMILWGGANDVYKNNSGDALKHLINFLELNKHTNIIMLCIPHRHDLPDWSCVNRGIRIFNRALMELMKLHTHVTVTQVDPARMYYTKHGQHMNNMGREKIASKLAEVIAGLFSTEEEIISCL